MFRHPLSYKFEGFLIIFTNIVKISLSSPQRYPTFKQLTPDFNGLQFFIHLKETNFNIPITFHHCLSTAGLDYPSYFAINFTSTSQYLRSR